MALNVFEGARRIAYLISGIILIAGAYITYDVSPSEALYYNVIEPSAPARRAIGDSCPSQGRTSYMSGVTPKGHKVSIRICFEPGTFSDGRTLIPYKIQGDMIYGDTAYSENVSLYIRRYEAKFIMPEADGKEMDDKWMSIWLSSKWEVIQNTVLVLAGFWLFVILVGWIIRGFAGIPRGQDHRQKE